MYTLFQRVLSSAFSQLTITPKLQIPIEIFKTCRKLQILSLSANQILHIPEEITLLADLKILNLSGNRITHLPSQLSHLKSIHTLLLSYNQLKEVPSLLQMKSLKALDLSFNPLTVVLKQIEELYSLRILFLKGIKKELVKDLNFSKFILYKV